MHVREIILAGQIPKQPEEEIDIAGERDKKLARCECAWLVQLLHDVTRHGLFQSRQKTWRQQS